MTAVAQVAGAVVVGVGAHLIGVEVLLNAGIPGMVIVGVPDTAVAEARDRVRAAVVSSGGEWPRQRITVGLSPASLPKRGSTLDLPIALAILASSGVVPADALRATVAVGELGLDGTVRSVRGVIAIVREVLERGAARLLVPAANLAEAGLVPGVNVVGVSSLRQAVSVMRGEDVGEEPPDLDSEWSEADVDDAYDLRDVRGQREAKEAIEIAAAGGHHVVMSGPPGVGKTLIARCLPLIMPDLDERTALEVTAVHSVEGRLTSGRLIRRPPFIAPHHTASKVALIGGGSGNSVRAGAISLAHGGILFLDEAAEFPAAVLDALRQPLEAGSITIHRSGLNVDLPARVQLVLATNPCPCGKYGTAECRCRAQDLRRYAGRLSGPLLDRMDIRLDVCAPTRGQIREGDEEEPTAIVAARVAQARIRSHRRLADTPWSVNAAVPGPVLRRLWPADRRGTMALDECVERQRLSLRGADRALRVAWTLADLRGAERPCEEDVLRALALRGEGLRWAA